MFTTFAHAGHDHDEETTASEMKSDQSHQTMVAVESKTFVSAESDFSFTPFIISGVLVIIITAAIVGAAYLSSKKKPAKSSHK